jgi:hypothetical protein
MHTSPFVPTLATTRLWVIAPTVGLRFDVDGRGVPQA